MRRFIRALIGLGVLLVVWELADTIGMLNPLFVPSPITILTRLGRMFTESAFDADLVATILGWLLALGIATGVAVPAGILLGSVPVVHRAVAAVVEFLRAIPGVALIPLALVALGGGPQSKIVLAAFAGLWPILFNTIEGVGDVDAELIETARAYRVGRWRTLTFVRLPNLAPFALTGVRVAAATTLIVTVSIEFLAGNSTDGAPGLGYYVWNAGAQSGRMDIVIAGAVLTGAFGFLINHLLAGATNHWCAWAGRAAT